jgi:HSP20 family molecular chaperone IbpA
MSLINSFLPSLARTDRDQNVSIEPSTPSVKPRYEVRETDDAYGVTVYLPGVSKDTLEITAEAGEFRVYGRPAWTQPQGWTRLYRESAGLPFELTLAHDNALDSDKIAAELRDGVLRVSLPKAEALKPRRIAVS